MEQHRFASKVTNVATLVVALVLGLGAFESLAYAKPKSDPITTALVNYGRMERGDAKRILKQVNRVFEENAARRDLKYDWLRRAGNIAVFGAGSGPGANRQEFDQRMRAVILRLRGGLDVPMLRILFGRRGMPTLTCVRKFELDAQACDALSATGKREAALFPYLPPIDGVALQASLRGHGVKRRSAESLAKAVSALLAAPTNIQLNTPQQATEAQHWRRAMLRACPGGTNDFETQLRAWHLGASPGMGECLAHALAGSGYEEGTRRAAMVLGVSPKLAASFIRFGGGEPEPEPVRPEPGPTPVAKAGIPPNGAATTTTVREEPTPSLPATPPTPEKAVELANKHLAADRLGKAQAIYQWVLNQDPDNAQAAAGLGKTHLKARAPKSAVPHLDHALRLEPTNVGTGLMLAKAFAQSGQRDRAVAVLLHCRSIQPESEAVESGLVALGEIKPIPNQPPRDAVLREMQAIAEAVRGCKPGYDGAAELSIQVAGKTGEVLSTGVKHIDPAANRADESDAEAATDDKDADEEEAAATDADAENAAPVSPFDESERACIESVLLSVALPQFRQESIWIRFPFKF